MRLWFSWVGYKKDNAGKSHLWGILCREEGNYIRKYIFWGTVKSRAYIIEPTGLIDAFGKRTKKIAEGYKEITQDKIERHWPDFMDDIEMQFMLEKLR